MKYNREKRVREVKTMKEKGDRRIRSLTENHKDTKKQYDVKLMTMSTLEYLLVECTEELDQSVYRHEER